MTFAALAASDAASAFYGAGSPFAAPSVPPPPLPSAVVPLWPGAAPDERPGAFGPESSKCLTAGVPLDKCKDIMLTNVTVPTLAPYLVPGATSAVVIAPGGGYSGLAVNREGDDIAGWLNSIGVSAFVLKYRVPARDWLPFGAAPLADAQRAVGLVRAMAGGAAAPTLEASRIGFMGFSAGAHLTGHLNVAWQHRTYARVDAADDGPCRPDFAMMVYPWRSVTQPPVSEPLSGASASNVTKDTPPTMLVQAEDDPVHAENALFYWLALKQQAAAGSELHIYPRGGHGYGRCTVNQAAAKTFDAVCTWPDRGQLFLQKLGVAPKTGSSSSSSTAQ